MDHAIELWGQPSLTFSLCRFAPCCEILLLPPCADRFRLSLGACRLLTQTTAFTHLCTGLYPWTSATFMSWNPNPLRSTLIDFCLCKHQWRRLVPGFQLNTVCHINNQCMETYPRTPTAENPSRNSTQNSNKKFQHIGKWSRTPMFYTTVHVQGEII